jgi:hypothetical protein
MPLGSRLTVEGLQSNETYNFAIAGMQATASSCHVARGVCRQQCVACFALHGVFCRYSHCNVLAWHVLRRKLVADQILQTR